VLVCPLTNARVVEIALVFGFSIAVLVYCAASFSGAHGPSAAVSHARLFDLSRVAGGP